MGAALLLAACAPAWRAGGGTFDLAVPPGWTVVGNHRFLGNRELRLRSPDGRGTLHLQWIREDRTTEDVPLPSLLELRALEMGRGAGFESVIDHEEWIELDDRAAFACTGRTRWTRATQGRPPEERSPHDGAFALVASRVPPHVLWVTLAAPAGSLDGHASAFALLLESLRAGDPASQRPLEALPDMEPRSFDDPLFR
jgi:hypothetical protein